MTAIRLLCASLLVGLGCALPAAATTHSTDYTDLWYNAPAESEAGWGVNVIQQFDILFATFFVYGADGQPRWFAASATRSVAAPAGQNIFNGPLYEHTGTFYGLPWAGVGTRQVGNVSFVFTSPTSGAVSYTVDAVSVTKGLVRQTFAANNLAGRYIGGMTAIGSNCANSGNNGPALIQGELSVNHDNPAQPLFRIEYFDGSAVCTFTGTYSQNGRLGQVTGGTWSCDYGNAIEGNVGTFTLRELQASTTGMTARFTGADQFCFYEGYFGGVRDIL